VARDTARGLHRVRGRGLFLPRSGSVLVASQHGATGSDRGVVGYVAIGDAELHAKGAGR
jgi:hypothetical protein